MSKIAVIIDDMFHDREFAEPVESFKKESHEITIVGLQSGKEVKGKNDRSVVEIEKSVKDVHASDFDALFIPGGYSPDKLRAYPEAVDFVKGFADKKPVFSICHGPQLLISADMLKNRKVTCWKSLVQDVKNAGAEYLDKEVVEDGNFITSRQPSDLPIFISKSLDKLKEASEVGLSPCETSATGEQARTFNDDMPCKEQDV